jgi:hypothetical protein
MITNRYVSPLPSWVEFTISIIDNPYPDNLVATV